MAKLTRIGRRFKELRARGETALIPFIVAGDPDLERTKLLVRELEARGADLIELGVPFSDPHPRGDCLPNSFSEPLLGCRLGSGTPSGVRQGRPSDWPCPRFSPR